MFDEHKKIYLFFTDLRPNSTLQVTWTRNASQVTKIKISKNLRNLIYVISLFVISLTDCIFDAFNCWNHCIF